MELPRIDISSFSHCAFQEPSLIIHPTSAFAIFREQQLPALQKYAVVKHPGVFSPRKASIFLEACRRAAYSAWLCLTTTQKQPYRSTSRSAKGIYLNEKTTTAAAAVLPPPAEPPGATESNVVDAVLGISTDKAILRSYSKRCNDQENDPPAQKRKKRTGSNIGAYHMFMRERSPLVRKMVVNTAFRDGTMLAQGEVLRRTTAQVHQEFCILSEVDRCRYDTTAAEEKAERKQSRRNELMHSSTVISEVAHTLLSQMW